MPRHQTVCSRKAVGLKRFGGGADGGLKLANERARSLRKGMNEYERRLWGLLRTKRLEGFRFRRQHPIGRYTVDFFCPAAKLIVEQDGGQHGEEEEMYRDAERTRWLEARGYRVHRVWNADVMRRPNDVLEGIFRALTDPPSVSPSLRSARHLPPQGGKEGKLE